MNLVKKIIKLVSVLPLCVYFALFGSMEAVFAAPPSQEDLNSIYYDSVWHKTYDKEAMESSCPSDPSAILGASNGDNQLATWNFFRQKGLEPHMVAGLMGNMQAEAHFEPRLVEYGYRNSRGEISRAGKPSSLDDNIPPNANSKGQPGYGIVQWTSPGRKDALRNKVTNDPHGRKAGDITLQLERVWEELNGAYLRSTLNPLRATTPDQIGEATRIVTYNYEIPANKEKAVRQRTGFARAILAKYGSVQPTTPAPDVAVEGETTSDTTCSNLPGLAEGSTATAAIAFTAVSYSWPEGGHGLTPTAAYAQAIRRYNPGASNKGADCGAFVGTVMRSSGADPNYPLQGTAAQMSYVKSNPDKYTVTTSFTVGDLLPGDILIVGPGGGARYGHTYIYVGEQPNGRNKADASIGRRMPNLGYAEASDSRRGHYTLARLK